MIGCCPGLYRALKTVVSSSKPSYPYGSYNMHGRGASGMPSHRSGRTGGLGGTDIALSSFSGKGESYQSTSAYRSTSPASSQEKLAHPVDRGNIMVNYGVAITIEDRSSDYGRTTGFV